MIDELLSNSALHNPQVGYNTIAILWILSYQDYAMKYFEDYTLALLEKVSKVMVYCTWEKIVRIILLLFDNVKDNEVC